MPKLVEIEYWSDYPAAAGVRQGSIMGVTSASIEQSVDGSDSCEILIPESYAAQVTRGKVLRSLTDTGDIYEHRIRRRKRELGGTHRTLFGQGPLLELSTCGPISQTVGGVTSLDIAGIYTPSNWISTFILPYLTSRGMTYWSLGTVEYTGLVTLPEVATGYTPLGLLRALADLTGYEPKVTRVGTTGYIISFLQKIGSTAPSVVVALGRNLLALQEDEDDESLVSTVIPQGATVTGTGLPSSIGENAWTLGTSTGAGPYWIPLTDPLGGAAPIVYDDQVNNFYLLRRDGGTTQITDSRASDSAVQVSALTGLTTGEQVQIVLNTGATRLAELSNPSQTSKIIKVVKDDVARGERNLVTDGLFDQWTSRDQPTKWTPFTSVSTPYTSFLLTQHARTEVSQVTGLKANGLITSGATSVAIKGGPANAWLYKNETFTYPGSLTVNVAASVQLNGSGNATVTLISGFTINVPDNASITSGTLRPSALPVEGTNDYTMRAYGPTVNTANPPSASLQRVESETFSVKYVAGALAALNVSAGWSVVNNAGTTAGNTLTGAVVSDGTWDSRIMPGVMILDGTPTRLAWSVATPSIPALGTVHVTTMCSYTLTADKTVKVALLPSNGAAATGVHAYCRWVSLWLGDSTAPVPILWSQANKLWQRGNRELVARALASKGISFTYRDLSSVLGYRPSVEQVQLGASTILEDVGVTARVVGVQFNLLNEDDTRFTVDARTPDLIRLLSGSI